MAVTTQPGGADVELTRVDDVLPENSTGEQYRHPLWQQGRYSTVPLPGLNVETVFGKTAVRERLTGVFAGNWSFSWHGRYEWSVPGGTRSSEFATGDWSGYIARGNTWKNIHGVPIPLQWDGNWRDIQVPDGFSRGLSLAIEGRDVVVKEVENGSWAAGENLRPGDLIVGVGGQVFSKDGDAGVNFQEHVKKCGADNILNALSKVLPSGKVVFDDANETLKVITTIRVVRGADRRAATVWDRGTGVERYLRDAPRRGRKFLRIFARLNDGPGEAYSTQVQAWNAKAYPANNAYLRYGQTLEYAYGVPSTGLHRIGFEYGECNHHNSGCCGVPAGCCNPLHRNPKSGCCGFARAAPVRKQLSKRKVATKRVSNLRKLRATNRVYSGSGSGATQPGIVMLDEFVAVWDDDDHEETARAPARGGNAMVLEGLLQLGGCACINCRDVPGESPLLQKERSWLRFLGCSVLPRMCIWVSRCGFDLCGYFERESRHPDGDCPSCPCRCDEPGGFLANHILRGTLGCRACELMETRDFLLEAHVDDAFAESEIPLIEKKHFWSPPPEPGNGGA